MKQVNYTTYRSEGRKINMTDDMARVVLDMTRIEYVRYIKPLLKDKHDVPKA